MSTSDFKPVVEALNELNDDSAVPKNIKIKIGQISELLSSDSENSIKVNKVLQMLDEIAEDPNLESYTRTQIWNIASLLEKL